MPEVTRAAHTHPSPLSDTILASGCPVEAFASKKPLGKCSLGFQSIDEVFPGGGGQHINRPPSVSQRGDFEAQGVPPSRVG